MLGNLTQITVFRVMHNWSIRRIKALWYQLKIGKRFILALGWWYPCSQMRLPLCRDNGSFISNMATTIWGQW